MTLLELLTVITFMMPISVAMASARHAHAGIWGYALALLLALMVGTACGWALGFGARRVAVILGDNPETFGKRLCVGIYLCVSLLWPFVAGFLGGWATNSAFELLIPGRR